MKAFLTGALVATWITMAWLAIGLKEADATNSRLSAEVEDLKWYNSRTSHVKGLHVPHNQKAAYKAYWFTGMPIALQMAIHDHEDGFKGHELGYNGQTQFVTEYYDLDERQWGEMARSCSFLLWKWADSPPLQARFPKPLEYIASIYTGGPKAKYHSWFRSVESLEHRELAQERH